MEAERKIQFSVLPVEKSAQRRTDCCKSHRLQKESSRVQNQGLWEHAFLRRSIQEVCRNFMIPRSSQNKRGIKCEKKTWSVLNKRRTLFFTKCSVSLSHRLPKLILRFFVFVFFLIGKKVYYVCGSTQQ